MVADLADLESLAEDAIARANGDEDDPPSAFDIIERVLKTKVRRPAHMVTAGALARVEGRVVVAVKASLPIERAHFVAAHELGHALIREARLEFEDEERAADYAAGAILMPRRYVTKFYRWESFAPAKLAGEIVVTQTAASLRISEVTGVPLAAVSPSLVRVRGPEHWCWPDEGTIRRWVVKPCPGLTKVRLTDQKGRYALVAEGDVGGSAG